MISGIFAKVEMMNDAFLVSWSRGEVVHYEAYADLEPAMAFAEVFVGKPAEMVVLPSGETYWVASTSQSERTSCR